MHNEETYEELYRTIEVKTGLKEPTIIRRNFSIGENVSILTFGANRSKRLIDLRFFNGINLYVEPKL